MECSIEVENHTQSIDATVYGKPGFSIQLKFLPSELQIIYQIIRIQWLYRIQLLAPKLVHQFDEFGLERYHELSHLIDHAKAWPKYSRVFPKEAVELMKNMSVFKQLELEYGQLQILDEEDLGWENIYWRLVRPGTSDFGTLHADSWFVQLGYYGKQQYDASYEKIKIWAAIHTEVGKNGLLVIPGSHLKKDWKWHSEERGGQLKPVVDEKFNENDVQLLPTESGRAVIFHYDLLHGGAPNAANTTRISIECTFLVKRHRT